MDKFWAERFKLLTSPFRMLPRFIIPGETKCGTTTFFRCLEQHPSIASPDMKEPNNFIRYGGTWLFCRMHYPLYTKKLFRKGMITGEASVEYLSKKGTANAIYSLLPDIKLIILLRNPIRRAFSDYLMMKDAGREPEDFNVVARKVVNWLSDESLQRLVDVATTADDTPLRYITKGCYAKTIVPWLSTFPRANIKFIKSENFFSEPQRVLNETFDFLEVGHFIISDIPHHRKARLKAPLKRETVHLLDRFFAPYAVELQNVLGDEYDWAEDTAELLESCE